MRTSRFFFALTSKNRRTRFNSTFVTINQCESGKIRKVIFATIGTSENGQSVNLNLNARYLLVISSKLQIQ